MEKHHSLYLHSPVGEIEIRGTDTHISSVLFDPKSRSEQEGDIPALLQECAGQLKAYFEGKLKEFDLPMFQSGTPFQQSVWQKLLEIPFGHKASYMDIARRLKDEKSIRAVGTANGRNNIAIIVPCHRVIGSDGKLVGYAGGLWRKKWLLQHEASHSAEGLFAF